MAIEFIVVFQIFVSTGVQNLTVIKDNYPISVADSTDSVSDNYYDPVAHLSLQYVLDKLLRVWVNATGRFI